MVSAALTVTPLGGLPEVRSGDDLGALLLAALAAAGIGLVDGDIIAVTQKIISKAEGRLHRLSAVNPGEHACSLARETGKDARLVELILQESRAVLRVRNDLLIVEHRLGMVLANAGIDRSNTGDDADTVLLLPVDPDASAARLRHTLEAACGVRLGVMVTDSVGRAWRRGTIGIAIGTSGVAPFVDLRGQCDRGHRTLVSSDIAPADSLAAAAVLVMGEAAESTPAALIRGAAGCAGEAPAQAVLRPSHEDLFR